MRKQEVPEVLAHVFVKAGKNGGAVLDVPLPQEDLRGYLALWGVDLDNIEYADNRPPKYIQYDQCLKEEFDNSSMCGCWDYEVPACLEMVWIPDDLVKLNDALLLLTDDAWNMEEICAFAVIKEITIDEAVVEYQARNLNALWVPADNETDARDWLFHYNGLSWEDDAEAVAEYPLCWYEDNCYASGFVTIPGDATWYLQFN